MNRKNLAHTRLTVERLTVELVKLWQIGQEPAPDDRTLTPRELHERGLCNKVRLHYECQGRDDYRECD